MLSCQPPVLLDSKVVDQGGAAGGDQEVEDGGQLVISNQDQDQADGLQEPVHHVEPHRYKVPPEYRCQYLAFK